MTYVQANKDLVRRIINEVWNARRTDLVTEFFGDTTRAEAEAVHHRLTEAFPDLRILIEDLIAEADRVVARLTFIGTHRGRFRDIEPTGRTVSFGAIRIYRFDGNKVVETWAEQDAVGLLAQLGS